MNPRLSTISTLPPPVTSFPTSLLSIYEEQTCLSTGYHPLSFPSHWAPVITVGLTPSWPVSFNMPGGTVQSIGHCEEAHQRNHHLGEDGDYG